MSFINNGLLDFVHCPCKNLTYLFSTVAFVVMIVWFGFTTTCAISAYNH